MHRTWFWVAIAATGTTGLWGLALAVAKRAPGPAFSYGRAVAIGAMLIQVGLGFILYAQDMRPDGIHIFYGFVILFTFAFVYIYRPTFARRPALYYGVLLLFVMGLGFRAMANT